MLHRIFIAIRLPDFVKNELLAYKEKWPELPARWTKLENLHITLAFLGNISDKEIEELKIKVGEIAKKHRPFQLNFTKIAYGPTEKNPKMIWAIGEESKELLMLQKDLSKTPFTFHVTLGRLKEFEFSRIDPEERPQINEEISFSFRVESIEIMESKLKRTGPEYTILESVFLLNNS